MSLRFLKVLSLSIALTAACNTFAATATELLSQDLQAGIKTLPRETRFYHYMNINLGINPDKTPRRLEQTNLKDPAERYAMIQRRVVDASYSFFNLKNNNTYLANAGLGLYLAIDPFSSSPAAEADTGANFGSTMIEVTISSGTRYLDLMKDIPLREETIQAIVSETALSASSTAQLLLSRLEPNGRVSHKGFARDTLQFMAEVQNEAFRKMVHTVFNMNSIAMTEYGWQAATSAFCGSTVAHRSALVYVGGPSVQSAIKSLTMVHWLPNSVQLDAQESEALVRNKKLFSLLQPLRPLEKSFLLISDEAYTASKAGDKLTAQQLREQLPNIISNIQTTINTVYPDQAELNDLRSKTFECIK